MRKILLTADQMLAVYLGCLALIVLVVVFPPLPSHWLTEERLFRDLPLINVIGGGLTLLLAAVTASLLIWRSILFNAQVGLQRESNAADRFKLGVELLAETTPVTQKSGLVVLAQLARTEPDIYGDVVIDVFTEFVSGANREAWEVARGKRSSTSAAKPTRVTHDAMNRLGEIGQTPEVRALINARPNGRSVSVAMTSLQRGYWNGGNYSQMIFSDVLLEDTMITDAELQDCLFSDCSMNEASFTNCDLKETRIALPARFGTQNLFIGDSDLRGMDVRATSTELHLSYCNLTEATISVHSLSGEAFSYRPPKRIFAKEFPPEGFRVYDADGPGRWEQRGKAKVFRHAKNCQYWLYLRRGEPPQAVVPAGA